MTQLSLPFQEILDEPILFWSGSKYYKELSNFYPARTDIFLYGEWYRFKNAEAAYQAQKTRSQEDIIHYTTLNGGEAKNKSKLIPVRTDWNQKKDHAMWLALDSKFSRPKMKALLLSTGVTTLIHWAPWDQYWGWSEEKGGHNKLGKMLMDIRKDIRCNGEYPCDEWMFV